MSRYRAVAAHCFRIQIVYRYEVIMNLLEIPGRILFAWLLWGAVYAGRETVSGFTLNAMLLYYVLNSLLGSLDLSGGVSGEISGRIRDGSFTRYMVIPTSPQAHFIAQTLGTSAFYGVFALATAAVCALAFQVPWSPAADWGALLCALLMIPLGLTFMICFHFFMGILTFKFLDIGFFLRVQGAVLQFVTGGVVPLVLLPGGALRALRFVPFVHVGYTPVLLLMGRAEVGEGLAGLATLAVWTAAMAAVNRGMFRRLRIRYDGVGI